MNFAPSRGFRKPETGMSLTELMISMVVLAIGLGPLIILIAAAVASDNKNANDTTATLLAQMIIEQISSQSPSSPSAITITDCAGNSWTVTTTSGASPSGSGASLLSNGTIDFTQSYTSLTTSGYAMRYVVCTTGGSQATYDVRWNVMSVSTNTTSRLITASARSMNTGQLGNQFFTLPVTLHSIGGS
jgi:prepilin-type N-terminal cleavage/methylation domain-containing protein